MRAMILAAGLGTRLRPITDNIPKALVEVDGKPLIEHLIVKLKSNGFDDIIVNVHHFSNQIIDFLKQNNDFGVKISISDESNQLLDTGGALKQVGNLFDIKEDLLIHNVDILSNIDLKTFYQNHQEKSKNRLGTLLVSERKTSRYLLFDKENKLKGWTNIKTGEIKPSKNIDISQLEKKAFSGIHILSPQIFELLSQEENKFSIIDFYMKYCQAKSIVGSELDDIKLLDIGKPDALERAKEFLREIS